MSTPYIPFQADPTHIKKERNKAKELRQSQWWKQRIAKGVCHYCQGRFDPKELTMDHITPIARGGKSTKGNVVAACKACNQNKRHLTPAEMILYKTNKD